MAYVSNLILQTGNGVNFLTWNLIAGVTAYTVQRSTDGMTWSTLATPATNNYLDSAVAIGTNYFYQVGASLTPIGHTPTQPNSITPCAPGQINLGYLRYQTRLAADMLKSNFVTNDEWNFMLNNSIQELAGVLVQKFGEDYFLAPLQVFQSQGQQFIPLPDGTNFLNTNGMPDPNGKPALACFKVYGVDVNAFGANVASATGWVPMSRFNIADRNKNNFLLGAATGSVSGQFCQFQYREMGTSLQIIPANSGQSFRLWYVPLSPQLLQDTDMMPFGYAAWWEYVTNDVAAKALEKQQLFDQSMAKMNRKMAMLERIETEAANRDVGQPNTATNSRAMTGDPNFGFGGNGGGWGYGGGSGFGGF